MALLKLKNTDKSALIDDKDIPKTYGRNWFLSTAGVATSNGRGKTLLLHRLITNCPSKLVVDHINHNTLDNRSINLRICTQSQNIMNRRKPKNNTSGFKGVVWFKPVKKWQVCVRAYGKKYCVGYFKNKIQAAKAYDAKILQLHGDYSLTNFTHVNI